MKIMNNDKTALIYTDAHIESNHTVKSFVLFIQTSRELLKYVDTCLRQEAGTSMMQFLTLMILQNESGKIRPSELARLTQTKRHNITTLIRRMEKDSHIKVVINSHDRRGVDIQITEKGKETLAKSTKVANKIVDEIMHSFSEDDLSSFSNQLNLIMNSTRLGFKALAEDNKSVIHESKKE
jgi:DNA-binding MarR family transcriptional regulator